MTIEEMDFWRDILGGAASFIITLIILLGFYKLITSKDF